MKSNKILLIVLGVLAVGVSAHFLGSGRFAGLSATSAHLDLVPADTLVFAGGVQPIPARKLIEHAGSNYVEWLPREDVDQIRGALDLKDAADGVRLLSELLVFYLQRIAEPEKLLADLGLADEFYVTFYTVGLVPVVRLQLADRSAFNRTLAGVEQDARVAPLLRDLDGVEYKAYPLVEGAEAPSLAIAATGNDVAFTIDLGDSEALSIAIGATQPETSMADTGEIERINEKYGYSPFGTFLFNHRAIFTALTSADNQAGRTIDRWFADNAHAPELTLLRTPVCAQEFSSIADVWPRTVAGYRDMEITETGLTSEVHSIIEIGDPELVASLRRLRGNIPRSLIDSEDTEFAFALGLDVGEIGRVAGELVRYMKRWDYQCPGLAPLNQWGERAAQASMTASLGAAMGRGVKGVSVGLMDLNIDGAGRDLRLNEIDALLAISAEDPRVLLDNTGAIPGLGRLEVPEDGTPVDAWLPIPLAGGQLRLPLKLALSGDHLTAFAGPKAGRLAQALADDELEASGLLYYKLDYGSYFNLLTNTLGSRRGHQVRPQDRQMLEALGSINAEYRGHVDITEQGIELTGNIAVRN